MEASSSNDLKKDKANSSKAIKSLVKKQSSNDPGTSGISRAKIMLNDGLVVNNGEHRENPDDSTNDNDISIESVDGLSTSNCKQQNSSEDLDSITVESGKHEKSNDNENASGPTTKDNDESCILNIDFTNLKYEFAVGKRRDCQNLIYTTEEHQFYGKNRKENNQGETAYLCRLYSKSKCKSRIYLKEGKLYAKPDFIAHNHGPQKDERINFQAEFDIKKECGDLASLVNATTQTSAVSQIFDKHMRL